MYLATFCVAVYSLRSDLGPWSPHSETRADLPTASSAAVSQVSSIIMACSTLVLFTIATFLWASDLDILIRRLTIVFVDTDNDMVTRVVRANTSTAEIRYMNDVMFVIAVCHSYIIKNFSLTTQTSVPDRRRSYSGKPLDVDFRAATDNFVVADPHPLAVEHHRHRHPRPPLARLCGYVSTSHMLRCSSTSPT